MNFVWTRERSREKQHDRGRERSNENIFTFFHYFSVLRQLTRSHKTTRRILQEAGLQSTRALVKAYNDKRVLATSYYNTIRDLAPLQKQSPKDLKLLICTFLENVEALKALSFPVDSWDFLLFNMLHQKLDEVTRSEFEIQFRNQELPSFSDLSQFVQEQCKALAKAQESSPLPNSSKSQRNKPKVVSLMANTNDNSPSRSNFNKKCIICSSAHCLYRCPSFIAKTPTDRFALVKQHSYCVNCLNSPHSTRNCRSSSRCRICGSMHHTLLHLNPITSTSLSTPASSNCSNSDCPITMHSVSASNAQASQPATGTQSQGSNAQAVQPQSQPIMPAHYSVGTPLVPSSSPSLKQTPQSQGVSSMTSCITTSLQTTVLLSTAVVDILDAQGHFQKVRVLFDSGSMANFISESCANRLGLKRSHISVPIEGLNNMSSSFNKGASNCIIKPVDQDLPTYTFEVIILPQVNIDVSQWRHIHNLKLADSNFNSPGKIDLLLGAELVPYMLGPGRIFGDNGQPVAIESIFGWVFQGKTLCRGPVNLLSCHVSLGPSLGDILQQFWDIEQVPEKTYKFSSEDKGCEEFFRNTYYREDSGRFVVSLPFKSAVPEFGDTYHMTLRRFNFLESRLLKHPERYQQYLDFMHDYLQSGHMSLVPSSEVQSPTAFYLPHHCVYRPESTSTPLRVVFDCSAKGSKGISLNETLFTGPKLHQELPIILLRFRTFPIAFISDIKQMFRNILIAPQFRDFQRILWRSSPHEPIAEYRLNTVTFGFCCSPFLALRTLKELAVTESHRFPRAAEILENSVFVDDIVSGANDISEALKLQGELISLLKCGGFELKKWMIYLVAYLRFNPIENIKTGSTNSIARMNFVWTRERSREKQHDRGRERSNGGFLFSRKHLYVFPLFFCVTTTYEKP
nr:unnamed protein product [Callosobruchus analis]